MLTITVAFNELTDASRPLIISGQVCWNTPARGGQTYLGCSIEPAIPQVLLEHLASSGILERRTDQRQETSITLPAQWECDPNEVAASILNISEGGMCLLISEMRSVGDRIRLTLDDGNQKLRYIRATVCWQIDTDDGHVLGCVLDDQAAYLRLKHVANRQAAKAAAV
jgi:hypothetical protein